MKQSIQSGIDLNGLKVLIAVVNAGGFSAAARHLGVPSNRLSRQIQRLEETLGVRLLQRTTRRLSLTTAGQTLLDRAKPALEELESLYQQMGSHAIVPSGHLRIAAPADSWVVFSAERLTKFLDRYPEVSLEIHLSDDEVDLLSSGIDIAFCVGPIRDENVVARRLVLAKRIVVASPACIKAHGLPMDVNALSRYPCLALRGKEGVAIWPLVGPRGDATIKVPARLTINGMGALIDAAKAGLGAALVSELYTVKDLAAGNLVRLVPEYCQDLGGIYAVYPNRRHPPAALRAFIDFVLEEAGSALTIGLGGGSVTHDRGKH